MQLHIDEISYSVARGSHAVVLLDRASWHTTAKLGLPRNISLIFPPWRAPELNPVENVWQFRRTNWLATPSSRTWTTSSMSPVTRGTISSHSPTPSVPSASEYGLIKVKRDSRWYEDTAQRVGVSEASAIKWVQRARRLGDRCCAGTGGHRPSKTKPERAWLLAIIGAEPDITLAALSVRLRDERGVQADTGMLSRFFQTEGISFKKTVLPCEQDRPDVARKRKVWKRYQADIDPTHLVFIDETWAQTNMTRTHQPS